MKITRVTYKIHSYLTYRFNSYWIDKTAISVIQTIHKLSCHC